MAEISVLLCDVCGRHILPEPELGDRQGGPHVIVYPAYRQEIALCSTCVEPLEQFRHLGVRKLSGAVGAKEALDYLPRIDD